MLITGFHVLHGTQNMSSCMKVIPPILFTGSTYTSVALYLF